MSGLQNISKDLKKVVSDIRKNKAIDDFRGVPVNLYMRWLKHVRQRNKTTSLLKSFRRCPTDLELLEYFKSQGMTEVEAVRQGLRAFRGL